MPIVAKNQRTLKTELIVDLYGKTARRTFADRNPPQGSAIVIVSIQLTRQPRLAHFVRSTALYRKNQRSRQPAQSDCRPSINKFFHDPSTK